MQENRKETGLEIAIIGMTGRFQDAKCIDEFWDNLKSGIESITFFSDEELKEAGVTPGLLTEPNYVRAHGGHQDKDYFDNSFFGYSPKEAEVMDPQIRVFHECSWEALEKAGYDPTLYHGSIGVYAGASDNFSWRALEMIKGLGEDLGTFGTSILNNGLFLSTRVSHKLNLKGPSLTFFTACSTSLVAVHLACRALLTGECDIALAGGVSMATNTKRGYLYQEGMIFSPDGHCRTFDKRAQGTVFGEGVGIVVLKPLTDAITDGDSIHAVIKGSAINNDGIDKASFTAPGKKRIADVIRKALAISRVDTETITYVEAHGTATQLGDTIEISALTQAFKKEKKKFCRIGTLKTNIGHLDVAAGIAALIKTVLALKHKLIPPSLHFENPNPKIDFENSPFTVNAQLSRWENGFPLRAGVNSAGIGGTNAFIILEEAPETKSSSASREWQILLLSARSGSALNQATENLMEYLKRNTAVNLADVSYTLHVGRKTFQYRRMLVCSHINDAIQVLSTPGSRKIKTFLSKNENRDIIFLFSGLGSQYVNMGLELYQKELVFREEMNYCFEILKPLLEYDIKEILYPQNSVSGVSEVSRDKEDLATHNLQLATSSDQINQTEILQPLLFVFEYALARLLIKWGINPQAMIGYSFGEYVAACLSGVFTLEDALKLIVYRGKLIRELPPGFMLSVPLTKEEISPLLNNELSIAIDNGPSCIVAGPPAAVKAFEKQVKDKKIICMPLQTSHAIHSKMMEPIFEKFKESVSQVTLKKPQIPYISNVTGNWATGEEVMDPGYWAKHLSQTVQFAHGIKKLTQKPNSIFIEIGPGRDLSALVQRFIDNQSDQHILNLIRTPGKDVSDIYFLLNKMGQLWLYGKSIDWKAFYPGEKRHRIPLPTYPFERQRFRVEGYPFQIAADILSEGSFLGQRPDLADWFYIPSWKRTNWPGDAKRTDLAPSIWLIFIDEVGLGLKLVKELEKKGNQVIIVKVGTKFSKVNYMEYTINPAEDNDYKSLFKELNKKESIPGGMIHLWGVTDNNEDESGIEYIDQYLNLGFYSLLNIARAIGALSISDEFQIMVITNNMQTVVGEVRISPGKAAVLGAVKGIPKEYANITLRSIDVILPYKGFPGEARGEPCVHPGFSDSLPGENFMVRLLNECVTESIEPIVAFRDNYRWIPIYEPLRLDKSKEETWRLRDQGVYLITGGLGGIGYVLARHLAKSVQHPRLILTGRTKIPGKDEWNQWLDNHEEDDRISIKIKKVKELEKTGAEVLACSAEASDLNRMQQVINLAEEQFGQINGVIHSAGLPDGAMIQVRTREQSEILFSSKVRGTLVLERLLHHVKLDFFVLCSSIDSILSTAGQVGYCAANTFLNAFAHYKSNKDNTFTAAINWPRWQGLGMAVIQENLHKNLKGVDLTGGLSIEEGVDAFNRILGVSLPQVAVMKNNLGIMYERDKTIGTSDFMEEFETAKDSENVYLRPQLTAEYVSPQSELERTLAEIWQNSFGIEQIGKQDDFFELGGDSLKAIIVISKIHKELDVEIPISEFFNRPTVGGLAEYIGDTVEKHTYISIKPIEEKEYYSLSSAQKRLYILQKIEPDDVSYNQINITVFEGKVDKNRLEFTFEKLVERHESLRTSFAMIDNEPIQKINNKVDFKIEYFEVNHRGHHAGYAGLSPQEKKIIKNFIRPFDLSQVPLCRVGLIHTLPFGPNRVHPFQEGSFGDRHILMVDIHHIISDGISLDILTREFMALYSGKKLEPLSLKYRDYSQWQNRLSDADKIKRQEEYWLKQFEKGIPLLELPTDYKRPAVINLEGAIVWFEINKELYHRIKKILSETKVTLFMLLFAAYNILLSICTGKEDILIGSPAAGRTHADLQNIIGMFVNMLAFRNFPGRNKTFGKFLMEVKENSIKASENQDYQFDQLVEKLGLERSTNRNQLINTVFTLQGTDSSDMNRLEIENPGWNFKDHQNEIKAVKFDLMLDAHEKNDSIFMWFNYSTALFKKSTIVRMKKYFIEILEQGVENIHIKLKDIKVSSDFVATGSNLLKDRGGDFGF